MSSKYDAWLDDQWEQYCKDNNYGGYDNEEKETWHSVYIPWGSAYINCNFCGAKNLNTESYCYYCGDKI